ncbi:hypothetical protein BJ684DRAFT_14793, partial [Piptocephalis cylindrospora]
MASYFDDHGLEDPTKRRSKPSSSAIHPSVEHLFTSRNPSPMPSQGLAPQQQEQAAALASMFTALRQGRQGEAEANEETWFQNILAQLFEEAQGTGKAGPPPASKDFIASLAPLSTDQLDAEEACPVCTDDLRREDAGPIVRLPCYHTFDRACVVPWLEL